MPEQITEFTVFLSSPSNLNAERQVIVKTLLSLNEEFGEERGVQFRVFDWKRDAVPGISSESQAVISAQVKYDIYVGLLGTVFGTPTSSAGSGTEKEFIDAYDEYTKDPTSVRVMFYFNQQSNNIFEIEESQLAKVKDFRKRLGPKGVLYHDFEGVDALQETFRRHVRKLILNQWTESKWAVLPNLGETQTEEPTPQGMTTCYSGVQEEMPLGDSPGFLDLVLAIRTSSQQLSEHLDSVRNLSGGFVTSITVWSEQLTPVKTAEDTERQIGLYDDFAAQVLTYTGQMQRETGIFQRTTGDLIQGMRQLTALVVSEKIMSKTDLEGLIESFSNLVGTMMVLRFTIQTTRDKLAKAPSMTTSFRTAQRHLLGMFDEYISSYTVFGGAADEILLRLREALVDHDTSV